MKWSACLPVYLSIVWLSILGGCAGRNVPSQQDQVNVLEPTRNVARAVADSMTNSQESEEELIEAVKEAEVTPDERLVMNLEALGEFYMKQGKYDKAEPLYKRAVENREQRMGSHHSGVSPSLSNLGDLYTAMGRYDEAEKLFKRAIANEEGDTLGSSHYHEIPYLKAYAELLRKTNRISEADEMEAKAKKLESR
ncbi:MAG: tetratricopeptide repeat protein [Candidatus Melainabacteria bacterium]|nr:tetratricopeptide repeat protein [Candidatus Melainabacteria bacterium]